MPCDLRRAWTACASSRSMFSRTSVRSAEMPPSAMPKASQRLLVESKRKEWEQRHRQQDAFAESNYPEGAQLCLKCHTTAVVLMDGCMTCLACGESKCG